MAIRVLHYLRHLGLGGTEKTCQLFFEHASSDIEPIVVYEKSGQHPRLPEFEKGARVCGGELIEIDSYGGSNPDPSALQEVLSATRADILHVYRSGYQEFPVGQVEVPHVVETNVFGFLDGNPHIDRTLFMSKWLQTHALRGIRVPPRLSKRFDYVNNPVESPYSDSPISGLSSDIIWLGRCGRPDNGIYNSIAVDAAHMLRLQGYDVGFLAVAAPSNMVADLMRYEIPFKLIDPTTDPLVLSQFYNSVDIYAHARADGETFGVNIAEAMIHGKPVVTHIATPSVPGMGVFQSQTELVDDGLTGFIAANDAVNYMDALKRLIEDPGLRSRMGRVGLEKANREYHVDACISKLENIYREVVNG
jgi:glycosyltransferase involved in cell wall biosynthesis